MFNFLIGSLVLCCSRFKLNSCLKGNPYKTDVAKPFFFFFTANLGAKGELPVVVRICVCRKVFLLWVRWCHSCF